MDNTDFLLELLKGNELGRLKRELSQMMPVDVADFFETLSDEKLILLFRILPKDTAADVFSYMTKEQQQHVVVSISDKEVRALIADLYLDDTVDFLEELPAGVVKKVLKNVDENDRRLINDFLKYPPHTAGSIMTVEFVELKLGTTVKEAIEKIRSTGLDKETVYTCYCIDTQRKLLGVIALRTLLLASDEKTMADIMSERIISVQTTDDREAVVETIKKYDLLSVPVVDHENRLVGIVTVDDAMDVLEEEISEDIEIMSALAPSDKPYLDTGVFKLARNRITWLLVLMISSTISYSIIARYDAIIATFAVLSRFIPQIMDTGGNAGGQAGVLVIRNLALGEVQIGDVLRIVWKEMRVALICGVVLAAVNFVRLMVFTDVGTDIALVICSSLVCTVLIAKVVGCSLPLGAKRLGLDPALMASPMITTIVDSISLVVYFTIAANFLNISL